MFWNENLGFGYIKKLGCMAYAIGPACGVLAKPIAAIPKAPHGGGGETNALPKTAVWIEESYIYFVFIAQTYS